MSKGGFVEPFLKILGIFLIELGGMLFQHQHLAFVRIVQLVAVYRVSQEKKSIFWEVIILVILSKKVYIYIHTHTHTHARARALFRTVPEIELIQCTEEHHAVSRQEFQSCIDVDGGILENVLY
jgi:hypothetical protein